MTNRKGNVLHVISGALLYPVSIAVTYLLLISYQFDHPPGIIWLSILAIALGFMLPSAFLFAVYEGQLWLASKSRGEVPLRKFIACILGGVAIIIFHQTLMSVELSGVQLLLALNVSLLAILIGTHSNLKDYLGISGGLSEYGYPEL